MKIKGYGFIDKMKIKLIEVVNLIKAFGHKCFGQVNISE